MKEKLEQKPQEEQQQHILAPFLYLFVMDLARVPFQTFEEYDANEPGFAHPMLQGYIRAFQMKTDGKLSHELLQTVHHTAMTHFKGSEGSQYRSDWSNFPVTMYKKGKTRSPCYSATSTGLEQFISNWITNPKTSTHSFSIMDDPINPSIMLALKLDEGRNVFCSKTLDGVQVELYDKTKHFPLLIQAMTTDNICGEITTLEAVAKQDLQAKTQQMMQFIINNYDQEIAEAKEDDDKIRVICKHIQQINQLHPFMDGNIRTCYIILNKLLHDFNLPLSLPMNPNRLDCCSVDEVVTMVKEGQATYKSLLVNQDPKQFIVSTSTEIVPELKAFSCPGVDLKNRTVYDDFIQFVINSKPAFLEKVGSHKDTLKMRHEIQKLGASDTILKAIDDKKYGLALRHSCAANKPFLVKSIIALFSNELVKDLNQPSTNGNTALDWFDLKTTDSKEKREVQSLLMALGAKNNKLSLKDRILAPVEELSTALKL